jgi:hypothetical protein
MYVAMCLNFQESDYLTISYLLTSIYVLRRDIEDVLKDRFKAS